MVDAVQLESYAREMVSVIYPEAAPYLFVLTSDEWRDQLRSPLIGEFAGECRRIIGPMERRFIEARGEWRGTNPMITIMSDFAYSAPEVGGTIVHEIAHATKPSFFPQQTDPPADASSADSHRVWMESVFADMVKVNRFPWSADHGARHIRMCLHLAHRADLAGYPVDVDCACAGDHYGLSPAAVYADALGDEPERFLELSLRTIDALPAPAEFTELFESDTAQYQEKKV